MPSLDILYEMFDQYRKKAKECQDKKDFSSARRYYLLCAEQMYKIAKENDGELQKAQVSRARRFVELAESLPQQKIQKQGGEEETSDAEIKKPEKLTLEEALKALDDLEGLSDVKKQVHQWVEQIKVFKIRKDRGMNIPDMTYHLVFTGNPGTGKTTVARIMAQIYCALGILTEGHLVETDRSGLVAGYVGQTALKTKEILKKATGGVLFIDEAYSLVGSSSNDFGQEAIDTLLKAMEDNRKDLVVIVAGYEDLMNRFIQSNPGLLSRFKTIIHFSDYTGSEMYRIFERFCQKYQYIIDLETQETLKKYFDFLYRTRSKNFGNGRDVRNLFETVVTKQSNRVSCINDPSLEEMSTFRLSDLPSFIFENLEKEQNKPEKDEKKPEPEEKKPEPEKKKVESVILNPIDIPSLDKEIHKDKNEESLEPEEKILGEKDNSFNSEFKFDWDDIPLISFEDVAGLEKVKQTVQMKVLLPIQNPEAFRGYDKKNGGGLLLFGPPGTGKTMIAAAIAHEIGAKFCSVKVSDVLHQGAGQSEKAIRTLFAQARSFPCAVVYFDEMDSLAPKSTKSQYAKQLRSEFLSQLQGIESYSKGNDHILFLIAATNKPWDIDSAFVRPGRFGTRIYVGLPDREARKYMIEHALQKINKQQIVTMSDDIDVDAVTDRTEGFNCSDITNLIDTVKEISILRTLQTGVKCIVGADFEQAFETISSSVQKEDIERLLEWKAENAK